MWDLTTGKDLVTFKNHKFSPVAAVLSPDGKRVASVDRETLRVWDAETGRETFTRPARDDGHKRQRVAFSPNGTLLAYYASDSYAHVYSLSIARYVASVCPPLGQLPVIARVPGYYAYDNVAEVKVCDARTGQIVLGIKLPAGQESGTGLAFSPDGVRLAIGRSKGGPRLVDVASGKDVLELRDDSIDGLDFLSASAGGLSFSADGTRLAGESVSGGKIKVWDLNTGEETLALEGRAPVFSSEGNRLALLTNGGPIPVRILEAPLKLDEWRSSWRASAGNRALLWHRAEAGASVQANGWFAAAFHLDRVIEADPPQAKLFWERGVAQFNLSGSAEVF
jgi:WD40 repeat protein